MYFLKLILDNTHDYGSMITLVVYGFLVVLVTSGVVIHSDEHNALEIGITYLKKTLIIFLLTFPIGLAAILYSLALHEKGFQFANLYMKAWFELIITGFKDTPFYALAIFILPFCMRLAYLRLARPYISSWKRKLRVLQTGDAASDIRVEFGRIKAKMFDPQMFYTLGKTFWGLSLDGAAVYSDDEIFTKTHTKAVGPSQTGKGVILGVLLDQAIWKGWGAGFIDKKPDDFIFDILRESALRNGNRPFTVVDLTSNNTIGYHPFKYGKARDRRERTVMALGLRATGSDGDHYRGKAREIIDLLLPYWTTGTLSHLKDLLDSPPQTITPSQLLLIRTYGDNVKSPLNEFIQLKTLDPNGDGLDIAKVLKEGHVFYIRSDIQDTVVRQAEACLMEEIIQVVRDIELSNFVQLVIDEARFSMTETLADSLAVVLSKKLVMTLSYQSINDPLNISDKNTNAQSVKSGIETNSQNSLMYKPNDKDTAEWTASLTGEAQKTLTKMEKITRNEGGAEEWEGERTVGSQAENYIHTNKLYAMPARVGALIRQGALAELLCTAWIPVEKKLTLKGYLLLQDDLKNTSSDNDPITLDQPDQNVATVLYGDDPFGGSEDDSYHEESTVDDDDEDDLPSPPEHMLEGSSPIHTISAAQLDAIAAATLELTSNTKKTDKPKRSANLKPNNSGLNDIDGI